MPTDVMLVNLPMDDNWASRGGPELVAENLGLGYLAASLRRRGYAVKIADAIAEGLSAQEVFDRVVSANPRLLGSAIFQASRRAVVEFCRAIKQARPGVKIILGGQLARAATAQLFKAPDIDLLCTGEGESAICEVMAALDGGDFANIAGIAWRCEDGIRINPQALFVENLDSLAWPARDSLPAVMARGGLARLASSRGCYHKCAFCSIHRFLPASSASRWRARTTGDVIEEMEFLAKSHGVDVIGFNEDSFFGPSKAGYARAEELARTLIRKRSALKFAIACRADDVVEERFRLLKEAGLVVVEIGIESGAQTALDRWSKHISVEQNYRALEILDRLGLTANPGMILFDAHTTIGELRQNAGFFDRCASLKDMACRLELRVARKMIPYAGTPIRLRYAQEGRLHCDDLLDADYERYEFCDPRVEAICAAMEQWEAASAPVRSACWDLGSGGYSVEVARKVRPLAEELAHLTFRVFDAAVTAAESDGGWNWRSPKPWPNAFDSELNGLATRLVALYPAEVEAVS